MGHLFTRPDARCLFAQFKDSDGKWVKRSTGCTDRRSAEAVLARYEREGAPDPRGLSAHAAEGHSLDQALGRLIDISSANGRADGTVQMYSQKAGHLVRLLGHGRDVNSLTLDVVQSFLSSRRREGAALSKR